MADDRLTNADYVWNQLDYEHDALIEASAGTGKTYALESIVLKLICDKGYDAKSILLVTFTEKAAGELKNRVRKALDDKGRLPPDFDEMTICTIHSFCQRLLGEYAFENGVPMRCEVVGDSGALAHRAVLEALKDDVFCREYGTSLYDVLKDVEIKSIANLVATGQKMADDGDFAKLCQKMESAIAARKTKNGNKLIRRQEFLLRLVKLAHRLLEDMKRQNALLTFDDMVARAAEVVAGAPQTDEEKKAKEGFFKSIRGRYRVALVDEFQDTDRKQWDIFRTLFSCRENKMESGRPGFLIAVGDPKQAIYSFRGADVRVYCAARSVLTENDVTGEDGRPKWRKTLDETYRSKRSLVDAFNIFFRDDLEGGAAGKDVRGSNWFGGGRAGEGIGYDDVHYPRKGNGKFDGILEEREAAPVLLLEAMPKRIVPSASRNGIRFGNRSTCLPVFMENAAREMKYLNGLVPAYTMRAARPGDPQPRFRYGDMCVLVEGKADAAIVRRVLARSGIPYGQYKQQGLYDSPEAEGVLALLDYLANPSGRGNRSALLVSPIFNVHPSKLGRRTAEDEGAFDKFIAHLQEHARVKEWNRLFEQVMSDDRTALTHPRKDLCAFNRTRAATRQIFDAVLQERGPLAETVADFASTLRAWRKNDKAAGEDGALYKKESAADRVQIMTMHASKGLQFPIVFLAYGFSGQVKAGTSDDDRPSSLQERRRLLYVALTRAEHRLYLPWSRRAWEWNVKVAENRNGSGIGSAGSALLSGSDDGFLGKAIQVYFHGRHDEAFAPGREVDEAGGNSAGQVPCANGHAGRDARPEVAALEIPVLKSRRVQWDSFSSLHRHVVAAGSEIQDAAAEREVAVDGGISREAEPRDRKFSSGTLLARDNVSGNTFHEIMETLCKNDSAAGEVDFTTACNDGMDRDDSALMALIRQSMRTNLLANREKDGDSTEKTLLRMVQNALRTKISIGGTSFLLKGVLRKDRLAEVEFVASENRLLNLPKDREGALNGKIDLLVRVGGKAFIIDWKTNSLADYTDPKAVRAAMDDAGYHLQYQLYSLATAAWLKSSGLALAGVAYLFVRGGEAGAESGVFAKSCGVADVDGFRNDISAMGFFAAGKEAE